MADIKIKGVIRFKMKANHPDIDEVPEENRGKEMVFIDTYYINPDYFWGDDHIESYIKHDLALTAGGGYDTDTITDVKYELTRGV